MARSLASWSAAVFAALIIFSSGGASAQGRYALVIGNSNYQSVRPLPNPARDAAAVGDLLKSAGFDVRTALDLDQAAMRRAIQEFAQALAGKDDPKAVALVYFAGHGVQIDGENYLVPVDARIASDADIPLAAIRFTDVMNILEQIGNKTRLIFLDACRDDPFGGTAPHGLAIVTAPAGSLVVYSTSPGATAEDGTGANSPFTAALLSAAKTPGEPIEETIKDMRVAVNTATAGRQTPWDVSSLVESFSFFPRGDANAAPPAKPVAVSDTEQPNAPAPEQSAAVWRDKLKGLSADEALKTAVREDRVVVYRTVLELFPHAPYAAELRTILNRRIEMWAWLDAVNLNSATGYQAFVKLYAGDDLNGSARRLSGRLHSASANEAPDALGIAGPPTKTLIKEVAVSDCGGAGASPRPRPAPVLTPHIPIIIRTVRPTIRVPSVGIRP